MTTNEMLAKIRELKELEAMAKELDTEIESLKDELKAVLVAENADEKVVGSYILRYTLVKSNRFDSTTFKKTYNDLYKQFTKMTTSRRFSIS